LLDFLVLAVLVRVWVKQVVLVDTPKKLSTLLAFLLFLLPLGNLDLGVVLSTLAVLLMVVPLLSATICLPLVVTVPTVTSSTVEDFLA
jgi:hypothetical protein